MLYVGQMLLRVLNFLCEPKTALAKFIATQDEEGTSSLTSQSFECVRDCVCVSMYASVWESVCAISN